MQKIYTSRVHALVFGMTRNIHDSADIEQDIWLQVFKSIVRYNGNCLFFTWLHGVSKRRTLNFLSKNKKHRGLSLDEFENYSITLELISKTNIPRDIDRAALLKKVELYLAGCKKINRKTFELLIKGYSQTEIASILNERPGTVRNRIYIMRKQLLNLLDGADI